MADKVKNSPSDDLENPGWDDPAAELARINAILRAYGFEYPPGSRGVADLAHGYAERQEVLHELDPEHWAPMDGRP
jgi:hypothetical protein